VTSRAASWTPRLPTRRGRAVVLTTRASGLQSAVSLAWTYCDCAGPRQPVEYTASLSAYGEIALQRRSFTRRLDGPIVTTDSAAFMRLLADLHLPSNSVGTTLASIVGFACDALHSEFAGVMLVHRGGVVESAAVSDPLVSRGDALQMSLREGPCLAAMSVADIALIRRTADDPRWPAWGPAAYDIGIRSVLSVRLARNGNDPIGSLNVYNHRTDGFTGADIETAQILARHASIALETVGKVQAMERGLESRTSIGQAQGILMAQYGIDPDQAFNVLRRYSQSNNILLRDVAHRVVQNLGLPATDHASDYFEN
jgi:ANTAR domain/GAF domain